MTNKSYIQINYDAQACYNQIIPLVALEVSRKHGVHSNILSLVQKVMQQSKYFIKIGTQVMASYYGNNEATTLYETGQGSGCSSFIWTIMSSELFHIYTEESQGFTFTTPFQHEQHYIHVSAYVDEVNTHHSFPMESTIHQMITKAGKAAQKWNDLLHVASGKLSTEKCNYYFATWKNSTTGRTKIQDIDFPP